MSPLDLNLLPTAQVHLLLSCNTPYFVVPAGQAGCVVGRWDEEVDGGSPVLRDLRVEPRERTKYRLGPMVKVAEAGRVATHLLFFDPHGDKRCVCVEAVLLTEAGNVWTLDGDCLEYVYDAEKERFQHRDRYGIARVTTTTGFPALALRGYRLVDPFPVDPTTGISYIQHR